MKTHIFALSIVLFSSNALSSPITAIEPGFDSDSIANTPQSIDFTINFFGNEYSNLYINKRGNVTFNSSLSSFANDLNQHGQPIIAPFFEGITDSVNGSNITFGKGQFNGFGSYGINWTDVSGLGTTGTNTFQLILANRWDSDDDSTQFGDFDIIFNYGQVQWDKSLLGQTSRIGFSDDEGTTAERTMFQMHGSPGTFVDNTGSYSLIENRINSDRDGRYIFNFRSGRFVEPPINVSEPNTLLLFMIGFLLFVTTRKSLNRF